LAKERKATDVLLSIESRLERIEATMRALDFNVKLLLFLTIGEINLLIIKSSRLLILLGSDRDFSEVLNWSLFSNHFK
jgi:hypothetical protein